MLEHGFLCRLMINPDASKFKQYNISNILNTEYPLIQGDDTSHINHLDVEFYTTKVLLSNFNKRRSN